MRSIEKWMEVARWVDEVNAALSLPPAAYDYAYEEKQRKKDASKKKARDGKDKGHWGAALMEEEKDDHDELAPIDDVIELPGRRMLQISGDGRKRFGILGGTK